MNVFEVAIILIAQIGIMASTIFILSKFFLDDYIQGVLNDVGESFGKELSEVFEKPNVSRAMSILGKQSGESRNLKAAENEISLSVLESQIGQYKPILQQVLGIDIDEMIEEYGAPAILQLAQKYIPMAQGFFKQKNIGKSNKRNKPLDYQNMSR